jgi:hypothetical protein
MKKQLVAHGATITLVLGVLMTLMMPASADPPGGKVDVCHRTASESNPFVLINVPQDEANGHITGTNSQHNKKVYWKSDGTWDGISHSAGDLKLDYYAADGDSKNCTNGEEPPPPSEYPYEVNVCWTMQNTDGVEGTYSFPQTRGCEPPDCDETVEYQHDTYWIRDDADKEYLDGLTVLNSSADDASLEPHNYYSEVVEGDDCPPVVPKDAAYGVTLSTPSCDAPEVLTYEGQNVTFSGPASPVSGPGSVVVTATPDEGHEWSDGGTDARAVFDGTLAGPTGTQSTDASAPCYVPPTCTKDCHPTPPPPPVCTHSCHPVPPPHHHVTPPNSVTPPAPPAPPTTVDAGLSGIESATAATRNTMSGFALLLAAAGALLLGAGAVRRKI